MKFEFNKDAYSNMGLVVKHGNKDNTVIFFDEIEDAALYRAKLFRTDVEYQEEGFVNEVEILNEELNYITRENGNRINKKETSYYLTRPEIPSICDNKLCYQVYNDVKDIYSGKINRIFKIEFVEFDKVKYITSLESNRNDLYINVDFLPCGFYFICLEAEDRNGNIIKSSVPYYFKVNEISNKEILKAIRDECRAIRA